jgi:hypothetical protein
LANSGPGTKVGAGDVGRHQVRSELDALERQAQRAGQRAHQQRLGRAGHAGDQAVATHQQGDEQLLDHLVLPDDELAHFATYVTETFAEAANQFARLVPVHFRHG